MRMDGRFERLGEASILLDASMIPFRMDDNSGRPELDASLSTEQLRFVAGGNGDMRVSGDILIERSRWLRDATQGVSILSFSDPVPAPPTLLPDLFAGIDLDLKLRTSSPFRVDNNVLEDLEARADLELKGTLASPELTGRLDVERGHLDVNILGGAYEIERGVVTLDRELGRSVVNLSAIREDPIRIDGQLQLLTMKLRGSLEAIEWECSTPGDTSGVLGTARGCVDYLIFDAGNSRVTETNIEQGGDRNTILGSRFLPLAGRLAQLRVDEVIGNELPRANTVLPQMNLRVEQLGFVTDIETRSEWLQWGWGRLGFGFSYLRGYPGSLLRESRDFRGSFEILDRSSIDFAVRNRSFSNRVLVLDPANESSLELRQTFRLPTFR